MGFVGALIAMTAMGASTLHQPVSTPQGATGGAITFTEGTANGTNTIELQVPTSIASNVVLCLSAAGAISVGACP